MRMTSLFQEAAFPLSVLSGDAATPGKGHAFRVAPKCGEIQGWFEILNDGELERLALSDISRLEMSGGKVGINLQKWRVPTAVAGLSLLTPFPALLEVGAVSVAAVASGFVTPKIRFICEMSDGRYFTGILTAAGFGAVHTLWQKEVRQQAHPDPAHG